MKIDCTLPGGASLEKISFPQDAKGIVLVCPGGGYECLAPHEAEPVARAFVDMGWAGFVIRYSVFAGQALGTLPMRQLGAAVGVLRTAYPGLPVVVLGFSAGGHLAGSLGVHWQDAGLPRPDGLVLCYPVITAGDYAHRGSIRALAGNHDAAYYSLENYVGTHVPPVFLWQTADDATVPVENSLLFASALSRANVPFELHIYPSGLHGLSLATPEVEQPENGRHADAHIAGWLRDCGEWLEKYIRK